MRIPWLTSKITLEQFETFLAPYLGDNYDGLLLEDNYVTIRSNEQLTGDQELYITEWLYSVNNQPREVTTKFEKRDKTLKLVTVKAACDVDGLAECLLKIPGTPGTEEGRWISGGQAWFSGDHHYDDKVVGVYFTDEDNILGYGAGFVVGSYTDDEADEANRGWYIPKSPQMVKVEAIGGYGFGPSGLYIKIIGQKGGTAFTDVSLYVNLEWGRIE
jgi:hypothetical protein